MKILISNITLRSMNSNLVLDYSLSFLSLSFTCLVCSCSANSIIQNSLISREDQEKSSPQFQGEMSKFSTSFVTHKHKVFDSTLKLFPSLFLSFLQPPPGNICILVYSEAFFNVALHSPECRKLLPSKVSYTKEELCGGRWYLSIQPIFRDSTPLRRELLCSSSHSLTGD